MGRFEDMAKFKIGDRVRVVEVDGDYGCWLSRFVGKEGVVVEDDDPPNVKFDCGETDWGSEDYLELVEPAKPANPKIDSLTISVSAELTHITIGGKRFRLVPED